MPQRRYVLFLLPFLVGVIAIILFKMFSRPNIEVLSISEQMALQHHFYRYDREAGLAARGYFFAATFLAMVMMAIATISASISIVLKCRQTDSGFMFRFVLGGLAMSALVFVLLTGYKSSATVISFLGDRVFELTVDRYWMEKELSLNLSHWIDISNLLGITGAVFIALAICELAPEPTPVVAHGGDNAVFKQAASNLADRAQWLKYLLFSASMILITGIAVMQAWRSWPVPVLDALNKDTSKAFLELADASIQYHGLMFVLVLIAMFMPMTMWLQSSARKLSQAAVGATPTVTSDQWRKDNGLTLSFSDNLQRVIAVLSPFLVGPLMQIVEGGLKAVGGG